MTRPHMSKKWGGGPIDCECGGRIVEVRSTKQSVIKVLTPKSFIFLNVSRGTFGLSVFPFHVSRETFDLSVFSSHVSRETFGLSVFSFMFHVKHFIFSVTAHIQIECT